MMYEKELTSLDLDVAARTVYGEARGETFSGMLAVAWVIRNRSEIDLWNDGRPDWWGETLFQVCKKAYQFSCWNKHDPNLQKLMNLETTNGLYREALTAVCVALVSPIKEDPTEGATHYHHKGVHPRWATGKKHHYQHGPHLFYREIG